MVKILKKSTKSPRIYIIGPTYWIRFVLGIVAGIICGILHFGIEGIIMGIVLYAITFIAIPFVYNIPLNIKGGGRAYYTVGLGTYLSVWFTVWILLDTLLTH